MITAGTRCCGKCGRWFFGYSCPYCNIDGDQTKELDEVKEAKQFLKDSEVEK